MKVRPSVVICENNKILLLRYSYSGNDVYQFPGGNMEDAETLEATLARELQEELNLPVAVKAPLLTAQVINTKKNQATLHCLFHGQILQGTKPVINPEQTSALEAVWMAIDKLDQLNLYPSVGKKVKELLSSGSTQYEYLGLIEQPWF